MFIHIENCKKTSPHVIVYAVFERRYHIGPLMIGTQLKKLLHGEVVVSPHPKIISSTSIIKQSEYPDEECLSKANNKLYTLDEFNSALKNLNMASQFFFYAP